MRSKKSILFTCSKEKTYPRNEIILEILHTNHGFKVIEATSDFKSYLTRILEVYSKILLVRLKFKPDLIFVGFLSQPLLPFVKLLFPKTTIIADGFISLDDALVVDRKKIPKNSLPAKIIFKTEQLIFRIPQRIIFDTQSHVRHIKKKFGLETRKVDYLYLCASPKRFKSKDGFLPSKKFKVFYYSTYLPLHGVEVIIRAARLLDSKKNIYFTVVGSGQEKNKIVALVNRYNLKNIKLIDWVDYDRLPRKIDQHDLCLGGHFSSNPKTQWVIPGKAYQFAFMKKPIILSNSRANKELFTHLKNAIFCQVADSRDLADKIIFAQKNRQLLKKMGQSGYLVVHKALKESEKKLNKMVKKEL